jgi:hypothetical protein
MEGIEIPQRRNDPNLTGSVHEELSVIHRGRQLVRVLSA